MEQGMCDSWKGKCDIHEGEAMAARQGIKVAMEAGFVHFVLETDCVTVFEALKKGKREASPFGLILHDIYVLVSQCGSVSFSLVRRTGNSVAHSLTKKSLEVDELIVWLGDAVTADLLD
ncbi:hypothetical protein BVRB_5g121070 [Beta vulgaris subsp. vulgaris]|nr:hypothetical protein BVRB_5g121070 [Beta vulgaris subsp. vulgaris]